MRKHGSICYQNATNFEPYIYTDPQMTVKAYPHTMAWVPFGCYWVLWVDRARQPRKAVYLGEEKL